MRHWIGVILLWFCSIVYGQYAPAAGIQGSTAIYKDSSSIVSWATKVESFSPGSQNMSNVSAPNANFGLPEYALGPAEGTSTDVVSLGDGGSIVLSFAAPIQNGPGWDFVVFENSFSDTFLEFAFVEVSSDGLNFVRFPSHSLIPFDVQTSSFGSSDPTLVNNLAGKYRQGYGVPFDLAELIDSTQLDLQHIQFVRIVDVVGSIEVQYGSQDSQGNWINDPFPTEFESAGFDLDAIGVIHQDTWMTSVSEEQNSIVLLYPNPVTEILTIQTIGDIYWELYDLTGRLLGSGRENEIYISSLGLSAGNYVICVNGETHKLVVNAN